MTAKPRVGVYPGTFDPITYGHLDIIRRGAHLVDRLVIGVTTNPSKSPMFSVEERLAMVRREVAELPNVSVVDFDLLLMHFAEREGASLILRGLRAVSDFESELQMSQMNKRISGVDTLFIPTTSSHSFLASKLIREVARFGGDVESMVPACVAVRLKERSA